jgi:Spy/CpxP family protein refolding chaperone
MKKIVFSLLLMGATGFAFAQQTTEPMKADRQAKRQEMMQKRQQNWDQMKKDLNLTADQENKIKALHERNAADMKQKMAERKTDRENMKQEMKAKKEQNDAEMKKILSPEQYAKWNDIKAQKKSRTSEQDESLQREIKKHVRISFKIKRARIFALFYFPYF